MYDRSAIAAQVAKIRAEVERAGGATVRCEDLSILCPDEFSLSEQFMHVAMISQKEGWSFAFLADGSVRFGAYPEGYKSPAETETGRAGSTGSG